MAIGDTGYEFIKANGTVDEEKNLTHLTQKSYTQFMKEQGVTKEVLESVNNAHSALINGMIINNYNQILDQMDAAKKRGDDPRLETHTTTVATPQGQITDTTYGARTFPVPRDPSSKIEKPFVNKLEIRAHRTIDKEFVASAEETFRKRYVIGK